jgi:predicted outer membrane repeat protein
MKLKKTYLAAVAAITLTGPASAALLLTDNFNTDNQSAATFNDNLATDQGGSLATVTYTTVTGGADYQVQHSNAGNMLLVGNLFGQRDVFASLNRNFATDANSANAALEVSFTVAVFQGATLGDWAAFSIGSGQNNFVLNSANKFSALFQDDGGTQQFKNGTQPTIGSSATFTDGDTVKFVISNAAGTGSAFSSNGDTDVVNMYFNNTLAGTWTNLNFGSGDGYLTFEGRNSNSRFDNLSISTIPETSTTLLGGLGAMALLRRRRK